MIRSHRAALAAFLLDAPAWMRADLTDGDARMRERAADALAAIIVERLGGALAPAQVPAPAISLPDGGVLPIA